MWHCKIFVLFQTLLFVLMAALLAPAIASAQQPEPGPDATQVAPPADPTPEPEKQTPPKRVKKVVAKKVEPKKVEPKKALVAISPTPSSGPINAPAAPRSLADVAGAGAGAQALDIAAKLRQEGAGTCADSIDSAAAGSMVGVTQSNTISVWSDTPPRERHSASVVIGQRYGANQAVPFGATSIVASPGPTGGCDATVVQVVSSPLPCATVRGGIEGKGKPVDLAGLTLVQNGIDQTLLMPTGTNTCVVIAFKSTFAK